MAKLRRRSGAEVCLVTCTLGEEGQGGGPRGPAAPLCPSTRTTSARNGWIELKEAMDAGSASPTSPDSAGTRTIATRAWPTTRSGGGRSPVPSSKTGIFWTTDLLEASNELVPLIRDRRPQVLVAYNEIGGYGHPDHVQAHRVATYGTLLAGVPSYRPDLGEPWTVDRVVWSTMSATRMSEMIAQLRATGDTETFAGWEDAGDVRDGVVRHRHRRRGRRQRVRRPEARRDAGARDADPAGRHVLRRRQDVPWTPCGRTSTTAWPGPAAPRARTAPRSGPTTSSPAWADPTNR